MCKKNKYMYMMECKRTTHCTEASSRVVHRGCYVLMVSPAATHISVFTCWNNDLLPVGKTAYSREDTSVSHPLLYVGTTRNYIHCMDSRQNKSGLCVCVGGGAVVCCAHFSIQFSIY